VKGKDRFEILKSFLFRFLIGLLDMAMLHKIYCLSFLVTNALSLSLEFVSSSRCSSVTNACPLSLEFVSYAALQLIKKETTERSELSQSVKK
jgi:Na+-translocating ferredoxin:NAD+ oxidoreductase RnfC subunit